MREKSKRTAMSKEPSVLQALA